LGTPLYMSPEQVRGRSKEITPATDVYALGAILYELLAGRPPYQADTPLELYHRILNEDPVPPRQIRPDVPDVLETIALKALSKDPLGRYPSAKELAEDLARARAGEPVLARPPSWLDRLRRIGRRRPKALLAATTAALLLALSWPLVSARETAVVLEASGELTRGSEAGGPAIAPGGGLAEGQMLRTGPSGRAVLRTRRGARLTLGPGTLIQPLERGVWFLAYGTVVADAPGPLSLRSPHGRSETDEGVLRLEVSAASTWIEAVRGAVRVTRAEDGRQALLPAGSFIVAGAGREFAPNPVAQGLLGYWPFEEAEGNVARDASGRGHDGVFIRPPASGPGRKGSAARLEAGNYLEVPGLSGPGFPRSGTLSLWAKGDFRSQPYTDLFDTYEEGRQHLFARAVRGVPGLQVVFQADEYRFQHLLPIAEDDWNHLAIVWDAERQTGAVYLNGSLSYSGTLQAPPWKPDGQFFRFGGVGNVSTAFRGALDEIRLYAQPLGPEAIRDLFER
ncbi:MAG TPA: LamG-like jellyroll fold domain-containing protein, partial [Planctomycetota bacterium]|nr:LamG-like jellyroll fold domain-containing protein [Planctomycetota bacterium]